VFVVYEYDNNAPLYDDDDDDDDDDCDERWGVGQSLANTFSVTASDLPLSHHPSLPSHPLPIIMEPSPIITHHPSYGTSHQVLLQLSRMVDIPEERLGDEDLYLLSPREQLERIQELFDKVLV
jgi:hypothetical protein